MLRLKQCGSRIVAIDTYLVPPGSFAKLFVSNNSVIGVTFLYIWGRIRIAGVESLWNVVNIMSKTHSNIGCESAVQMGAHRI